MKVNQIAHGFYGGLIGFAFSAPLFLHWAWVETLKSRFKHNPSRLSFYISLGLILPGAILVGLTAPFISAALFGYKCFTENSLEPLAEVLKAPYRQHEMLSPKETNILRSMLFSAVVMITLMSFPVLNLITGGLFGFLGVPGMLLASAFGLEHSGILLITALSLGVTTVSSFAAGLIAGAADLLFSPPNISQPRQAPSSHHEFSTSYAPLNTSSEYSEKDQNLQTFAALPKFSQFLPNWQAAWQREQYEMVSLNPAQGEDEGQHVMYFDEVRPVAELQDGSGPSTQTAAQGMNI